LNTFLHRRLPVLYVVSQNMFSDTSSLRKQIAADGNQQNAEKSGAR